MAWTFSDWDSYDLGSTERREHRRAFLVELRDALKSGSYTITGRSVSKVEIEKLLAATQKIDQQESVSEDIASGARIQWSRGKPLL